MPHAGLICFVSRTTRHGTSTYGQACFLITENGTRVAYHREDEHGAMETRHVQDIVLDHYAVAFIQKLSA